MSGRDDFSNPVKDALAKRVAFHCSNPECDAPTSGPHTVSDRSINLGVAAHITAASAKGPRYDAALSEEERTSAINGIWLCQLCAALVDRDLERFTVSTLRDWKQRAEENAAAKLGRSSSAGSAIAQGEPLFVKFQFEDHLGIKALNRRLSASGFSSRWVHEREVAAKRTLGYHVWHFEGHPVRTSTARGALVWMVRPPKSPM